MICLFVMFSANNLIKIYYRQLLLLCESISSRDYIIWFRYQKLHIACCMCVILEVILLLLFMWNIATKCVYLSVSTTNIHTLKPSTIFVFMQLFMYVRVHVWYREHKGNGKWINEFIVLYILGNFFKKCNRNDIFFGFVEELV